jgi:hypothetical protein
MARHFVLSTMAVLLVACASQSQRHEADLAQLLDWYPGNYSNVEQVEADAQAGREPHTPLELTIVRVYAPLVGENAFYLQETAAKDPRRVISQRIAAFEVVKDRGIVQSLWIPVEPLRWRDAHLDPNLFKSMMPQDFTPLAGCEIAWTQKEGRYVGANDMKACRATSSAGGTARMDLRAELTADELALAEQSYNVSGKLVQGHTTEPFYRFRRR